MNLRQSFVATLAALVGAGCLWATPAPARAADTGLAVLVVGKTSDQTLARKEHVIVDGLTRARAQRGWTHQVLPIYSYHFDKSVERTYCEQRLQVKPSDLVVVGLVELESGVPIRFIVRENDVATAPPVAAEMMDRAQQEMAARGVLPMATRKAARPAAVEPVKPARARPVAHRMAVPAVHHSAPVMAAKPVPAHPATEPPALTRPAHPATEPPVIRRPAPAASPPPVATAPVATHPAEPWETSGASSTAPPPLKYDARGAIIVPPPAGSEGTMTAAEHWTVQVGLFESLQKARALAHGLKARGSRVEIRKARRDSMVVYRVLTGFFHNKADAWRRARALQDVGISAFSVRLDQMLGTVIP